MSKRSSAFCILAAALVVALGQARAEGFDTSMPVTMHAGAPRAIAASPELDARRSGLSRVSFPSRPSASYRVKLSAPIQHPPVADERGLLFVAHGAGKLTQLDARGRPTWSVRAGPDLPAAAPVIGNDGTRWLAMTTGDVVGVTAEGRLRVRKPLAGLGTLSAASLLPLATSGVAVMSDRRLAVLDRDGGLLWLGQSEDPLRAVLERRGELLAVTSRGRVLERGAEGQLVTAFDLRGGVSAAALLPSGDQLAVVLDQRELVVLDLGTARRRVLFAEPALTLAPGLAIGAKGEFRLLGNNGLLLGLSADGQETFRAPLASAALAPGQTLPPPLIDSRGYSAVTLPDSGLTLVSPSGELAIVAGSACPEPLRPTPAAMNLLVLACRSGLVFAFSDKAR